MLKWLVLSDYLRPLVDSDSSYKPYSLTLQYHDHVMLIRTNTSFHLNYP
jgi:hypothetical protein